MDTAFTNTFEYKVIYIFTIRDEVHKGLVKIGDATLHTNLSRQQLIPNSHALNQAAFKRIKSYTNTAGITPDLLYTELAIREQKGKDGKIFLQAFRDYQVHNVLKNSGIENKIIGQSTGKEWFAIDLATAKKAIQAVKKGYANLGNAVVKESEPIVFRPEQEACIKKAVKHFKKADRFLINAKMRYGKTLVALEIIKRCRFKRTIILTHRPVVNAGWYEDFGKIFAGQEDILYGSKKNGYTVEQLLQTGKKFIYFASLQDLRGSAEVGGKFAKNTVIFDTRWDCVIVDEAHEGTTTALGEDTVKAVFKEGSGSKFLALSGTPFNILADYDEEAIYTWDYIMEQECKAKWDETHFGDPNPYDELPELRIYTYDLGDILKSPQYITFEDKAFNFHEFFRTFTGDFDLDYVAMPEGVNVGDFVHEKDVWSFLNLMTKEDEHSQYPYANEKYRHVFKHSLWMVPGIREAKALKRLMLKHPVFGSGQFEIVNVAGPGDEEEKATEALTKVKKAIQEAKDNDTYTITLSCGKLTAGVTVKEWTAVFMLAGSSSTAAASYLQTIFRVQSPCNDNGKIKENAYVFDFAPDRTLKMVSKAVQIAAKAGQTTATDKQIMGRFLNYCPIIAISGSGMKEYSTNRLLQQLKRAYAERVVFNGFDDSRLYNDKLLKLNKVDLEKFADLKKIVGASKAALTTKEITLNDQGMSDEEYEKQKKLKKKKKKELTAAEKAWLEEMKKKKKSRESAISILRGISIRMPLLIYGADIPYEEEITLNRFVDLVDNNSWKEFIPAGVTKSIFKNFQEYYDEDIFIEAGRNIRNIARQADTLVPTERVKKITELFSHFRNPDKETVLTPWRVVNMHLSDCLGGWCFYDQTFKEENKLAVPRFVEQGKVTKDIFGKLDTKILEINSKSGLYPLYMTYSIYRQRLYEYRGKRLTIQARQHLWLQTVKENIFVICKTPMAKAITKRTLAGYEDSVINAHYFKDLVNTMKNKPQQFKKRVRKCSYWKKGKGEMEFDAIVGNPPYMEMDNGNRNSSTPIYQYFVTQAKKISPNYISMITPSRWFAGGKGLDLFRVEMLQDTHIEKIVDYIDSTQCFKGVDIAGGVNYFLWNRRYNGLCTFTSVRGNNINTEQRKLDEYDILIRNNLSARVIRTVVNSCDQKMDRYVGSRNTFGLATDEPGKQQMNNSSDLILARSQKGNQLTFTFISRNKIEKEMPLIDKYKVVIGRSVPRNGEVGIDPSIGYRAITTVHIFGPKIVFTDTYLLLASFDVREEAENFASYMTLKFPRFLLHETYSSMAISKNNFQFVPYLDYSRRWTDSELFKKYKCTDDEINMINSMMRPLEYKIHLFSDLSMN